MSSELQQNYTSDVTYCSRCPVNYDRTTPLTSLTAVDGRALRVQVERAPGGRPVGVVAHVGALVGVALEARAFAELGGARARVGAERTPGVDGLREQVARPHVAARYGGLRSCSEGNVFI